MRIVPCRFCGLPIASNAYSCPRCGGIVKKTGSGCSTWLLAIFALVMTAGMVTCSVRKEAAKREKEIEESRETARKVTRKREQMASLPKIFDDLKARKDLKQYLLDGTTLLIVYAGNELPDNVAQEVNTLAQRGTRHLDGAEFKVDCMVSDSAAVLYSETHTGDEVTAVGFSRNSLAADQEKENRRLAAAEKLKQAAYDRAILKLKKKISADFCKKFEDFRTGECWPVSRYVRQSCHDPSSFEHVKTTIYLPNDDGLIPVTMKFRAKNMFGAKVLYEKNFLVTPDGKTVVQVD